MKLEWEVLSGRGGLPVL